MSQEEQDIERTKPTQPEPERPTQPGDAPEDQPGEPGAEGGSDSPSRGKLPAAPSDEDSAVGDTDQHSTG